MTVDRVHVSKYAKVPTISVITYDIFYLENGYCHGVYVLIEFN